MKINNYLGEHNRSSIQLKSVNKSIKEKQNNISFEGYKLIDVFADPNYTWIKDYVYELSNKMKVAIVPKPGKDMISINTLARVGALNEKDKVRGISHFHEHLAFDGYDAPGGLKPDEFVKIVEAKGSDVNAYTSNEITNYLVNCSNLKNKDLKEIILAQSKIIKHIKVAKEPYEKEQEIVIQEIKQYNDQPKERLLNDVIKNLFGINSTSKDLTLGRVKNIKNIKLEDVMDYHKSGYSPDNMEMYIVGNVNPEKVIKYVDKAYDTKDFRPSNIPINYENLKVTDKPVITFEKGSKIKNSYIAIGISGTQNFSQEESVAAEALLKVIVDGKHSRLNIKMSKIDRKFESMYLTASSKPEHTQLFYFKTSVKPGEEQRALDIFKETISEIKTNPVTEEELLIAKNAMIDDLSMISEKSTQIATLLTSFSVKGGVSAYAKYMDNIKSLKVDDLNNVAKKYLDANKAGIVILQPKKNVNKNISFNGALLPPKNVKKYILPNNIKVVFNDVSDKIYSSIGIKFESEVSSKAGVGDILAQMLINSSAKHSEDEFALHKAIQGVRNLEIIDIPNGIFITSDSAKEFLQPAIKIIKEAVFEPKFCEDNFLKAKNEIKNNILSEGQTAFDRASEQMYGKTYEGVSNRVISNEIDNVTLQDVKNHYNSIMKNTRAKVVVTAPFSKDKGLSNKLLDELKSINYKFSQAKIKKKYFDFPKENIIVAQSQSGIEQSDILRLIHVDSPNIKEKAAITLLDAILGSGLTSRLFLDLREKQKLCYGVATKFIIKPEYGQHLLSIKTGIKDLAGKITNNIERSINGFDKHIKLLTDTLPTEEELSGAKKVILSGLDNDFADANTQNFAIFNGLNTREGLFFVNKFAKEIKKVSAQDVQDVAKKYLTQTSVTSIISSKLSLKNAQTFLKEKGNYKFFKNDKV